MITRLRPGAGSYAYLTARGNMGGLSSFSDDEETRWAKAASRSEGLADLGVDGALRKYFLFYLPLGAVALTVLGFGVAALAFGDLDENWLSALGLGISFASLGCMIGGLVYASKAVRPLIQPQRSGVMLYLHPEEQKSLRRQVDGRAPLMPDQLGVARGVAVQLRQGLATQLLVLPGLLLMYIGQVLNSGTGGIIRGIQALLFLLVLAAACFTGWQYRQTGKFLMQTSGS